MAELVTALQAALESSDPARIEKEQRRLADVLRERRIASYYRYGAMALHAVRDAILFTKELRLEMLPALEEAITVASQNNPGQEEVVQVTRILDRAGFDLFPVHD